MDDTLKDEAKSSTSVLMELHGSTDDSDDEGGARPAYHHVDEVTSRPPADGAGVDGEPGAAADRGFTDGTPASPPPPPRRAEQRQQKPRSTTRCRVIPIVVSGQSTARLGQLCFETADPRQ